MRIFRNKLFSLLLSQINGYNLFFYIYVIQKIRIFSLSVKGISGTSLTDKDNGTEISSASDKIMWMNGNYE